MVIVMGVSGSGKTTVATLLAARLGAAFAEGDAMHPAANVAKMASGHPLDDADRAPWLAAIAAVIDAWAAAGRAGVVTCSALRRVYRDTLTRGRPGVVLCYLKGDRAQIAGRLAHRAHHFMPAALLDSQFATLEEPAPDERAVTVPIDGSPDIIVGAIIARLDARKEPA